ncbi:hypothetical protein BDV29DRAFT_167344 [Aspergillus leporis]|uniref:Fe2OG dioxygenase domain-containing protein n=1 Tax=Aspergillus leporis TaxID=41062 RepID=A0A5N5XB63_9EURO|nr:hypothetical protein BDV29DRAFT_167344 [Aspergillus leporis]
MPKRIQSFFQPISKKPKLQSSPDLSQPPQNHEEAENEVDLLPPTHHPTYPFPIADLPPQISNPLSNISSLNPPKPITNHPHLDLLYFEHLIPPKTAKSLFTFLRKELPFYRVQYTTRRGPTETKINTPRFTTVFGVDATSHFTRSPDSPTPTLLDSKTLKPPPFQKYKCKPRPLPTCLETLRLAVQTATNHPKETPYNFCLVNYYASGSDSISYHSDDERFLGANPTIASLSLGAKRDFLLKHKPGIEAGALKFPLASGDMVVMRGETQSNWLHSIPKRKGGEAGLGRINITFRRAVVPGGTENYYRYNVGDGGVYRWCEEEGRMVEVDSDGDGKGSDQDGSV